MEDPSEFPKWRAYFDPVYSVTADCVLEWPDGPNCNELPVICPVHGTLSRWSPDNISCLCPYARRKIVLPQIEKPKEVAKQDEASIRAMLLRIWGGEDIPCGFRFLNSGTPADSLANRRTAFTGNQMSLTPRGPCVIHDHSLRALTDKNRRPPLPQPDKLRLGFVYAYLRDLDLFPEWCAVYKSQIRHVMPKDVNIKEGYKEIMVYRKQYCSGLLVNIFPNTRCFITCVDYAQFEIRPDLHYGDQLLELNHCILKREAVDLSRQPSEHDVFRLRVRPCPFLRRLWIRMGPCPLATERERLKIRRGSLNSNRDLGFQISNGCVTSVAVGSPAREAGMEPDHHIIEIDGHFMVSHSDTEMVHYMRIAISKSRSRAVEVVVLPERIYRQLKSVNNPHHIATNTGFNLDSWIKAEAFGF